MPIEDAVKKSKDGVIIDFEVNPGSKSLCIPSGFNDWRKRIEVKLTQNAQKGKAMNRNYLWLIVTILLVGLMLTTMLATAQEAEPTIQWEYKVTVLPHRVTSRPDHERIEAKLNELGQAGWELVGWDDSSCILKRPVN